MSRQLKLVGGATAIFLCACVFARYADTLAQEPRGQLRSRDS